MLSVPVPVGVRDICQRVDACDAGEGLGGTQLVDGVLHLASIARRNSSTDFLPYMRTPIRTFHGPTFLSASPGDV